MESDIRCHFDVTEVMTELLWRRKRSFFVHGRRNWVSY
jgi:hypothetical protein